jgi:hypothetical protein
MRRRSRSKTIRIYTARRMSRERAEDCDAVLWQRIYEAVKAGMKRATMVRVLGHLFYDAGRVWDELQVKRVLDL